MLSPLKTLEAEAARHTALRARGRDVSLLPQSAADSAGQ